MRHLLLVLLLLILGHFLSVTDCLAADHNIFGLHLIQTADINSVAPVINSTGGDWGYITIVIRTDQFDYRTWQDFFDQCRRLHLVPIVRLATILDGPNWQAPTLSDIDNLADFLNTLNWPTTTQYVIPFNEPNHASEWGGGVDAADYANKFIYTALKLKSLNPNFFVLGPALDLAAPDMAPDHLSAATFYQQILTTDRQFFDRLDGLASHSYPNHGYIGKPTDRGQHSILGFLWEQSFIKNLGINKTYPVFITETGWPHSEGQARTNTYYTANTSAKFLIQAISIWQKYPQVKAITPFIYNYSAPPFDHFSWLDPTEKLYPAYQQVVNLPKVPNQPPQITSYRIDRLQFPFLIFANKQYSTTLRLTNTGQSIWGEYPDSQFCLTPDPNPNISVSSVCNSTSDLVLPGQSIDIPFKFTITHNTKNLVLSWPNGPSYELTALSPSSSIYRPKTHLLDRLRSWIKGH